MKKLLPLLLLVVLLISCEDEDTQTFDVNDTFDTNDIIWEGYPTVEEVTYVEFSSPDANSVEEAAQQMRESIHGVVTAFGFQAPNPAIDIKVTIGDETHTASFEDFFEWMGFDDEPNAPEFCITKFGDGTVEEIDFISPDDPNCLITVNDFLLKLVMY